MDSLVFRCPGCQQPFQVLAQQAGQMVRCPGCEDTVQIPTASPPSPSPPEVTQQPSALKVNLKEESKVKSDAGTKAEEVQAYECPKCEKPFGILPSMLGSEMACPHCEKTVFLKPTPNATSPPVVPSPPTVKSRTKPKVPAKEQAAAEVVKPKPKPKHKLKSKPKQKLEVTGRAESKGKPEPNTTEPPAAPQRNTVTSSSPVVADQREADDVAAEANETRDVDESAEAAVAAFVPQPVDHLLPPKFAAVDPAFFYRRHQDGSQVLLPNEDGSVEVVDNRIVRIEHNGKTYDLVSSPEYDRIQKAVVNNLLAVLICGLLIAIVMTLLNG